MIRTLDTIIIIMSGCLVLWLRVRFTCNHNFLCLVTFSPQFFNDNPTINYGTTTSIKKQLSATSCNGKIDEQWSMTPLFIHFLSTIEHDFTVHPFSSMNSKINPARPVWFKAKNTLNRV